MSPVQEIALSHIRVNPSQPRKHFAKEALQELAQSIQLHGIIQPLTVRRVGKTYQLIAGERRLQAARIVGLTHVPAYVRTVNDQEMLEMALVENIQRVDLNPIEIALSYQQLLTGLGMKQEILGKRVGKSRATVTNYLRLLKLPPDIQVALRDQKISMGHARALISVNGIHTQLRLFQRIIRQNLSVRQVEALVRGMEEKVAGRKTAKKEPAAPSVTLSTTQRLGLQLAEHLHTPVKIQTNASGGGMLEISFASTDILHRILALLQRK